MRKTVLKVISVMLTFVMMSLPAFSNLSATEIKDTPVINETEVLKTRFLNMLNHSFVYGEDFNDLETIVNNSVIALLEYSTDDGYINEDIVNGYLFDMYGVKINDFSVINPQFESKEGYVYILPRGYSLYKHTGVSLTENQDGTLTLITNVTIKSHDRCEENLTAKTMFVKNDNSVFGYNIVFSEILD